MNRLRLLMFVGFHFFGLGAEATSFIERPFEETVNAAPIIVRGRVQSTAVEWGSLPNGGKQIYTFTNLTLDEVIKSPGEFKGSSLRMRTLGGEKDGVGMTVSGSAEFQPGEDVVVLLRGANADGSYDVAGMMMGKLTVEKNAEGEDTLVGPALVMHAPEGHAEGEGEANRSGKAWTLTMLRDFTRRSGSAPASSGTPSVTATSSPSGSGLTVPAERTPIATEINNVNTPEASIKTSVGWTVGSLIAAFGVAWFFLRRR